jgi:hypothetical protein
MISWLVLKLEISYYNRVMIYLEGFWVSFRGFFFMKIIFLAGEIFE